MSAERSVRLPLLDLAMWRELAEAGNLTALAEYVLAFANEKAPKPAERRPAVAPAEFVAIARDCLGDLLVLPERPSGAWYGKLSAMLRSGGIESHLEAHELCEHVATWVKRPILAEVIAAKSGSWLAMARAKAPRDTPARPGGTPVTYMEID